MIKLKDVLIEARRLLAEIGWIQGCWAATTDGRNTSWTIAADQLIKDPQCHPCGGFCAKGALLVALREAGSQDGDQDPLYRAACERVCIEISRSADFPPAGWLSLWNDQVGRSKEEVLSAFDKAITNCSEIP